MERVKNLASEGEIVIKKKGGARVEPIVRADAYNYGEDSVEETTEREMSATVDSEHTDGKRGRTRFSSRLSSRGVTSGRGGKSLASSQRMSRRFAGHPARSGQTPRSSISHPTIPTHIQQARELTSAPLPPTPSFSTLSSAKNSIISALRASLESLPSFIAQTNDVFDVLESVAVSCAQLSAMGIRTIDPDSPAPSLPTVPTPLSNDTVTRAREKDLKRLLGDHDRRGVVVGPSNASSTNSHLWDTVVSLVCECESILDSLQQTDASANLLLKSRFLTGNKTSIPSEIETFDTFIDRSNQFIDEFVRTYVRNGPELLATAMERDSKNKAVNVRRMREDREVVFFSSRDAAVAVWMRVSQLVTEVNFKATVLSDIVDDFNSVCTLLGEDGDVAKAEEKAMNEGGMVVDPFALSLHDKLHMDTMRRGTVAVGAGIIASPFIAGSTSMTKSAMSVSMLDGSGEGLDKPGKQQHSFFVPLARFLQPDHFYVLLLALRNTVKNWNALIDRIFLDLPPASDLLKFVDRDTRIINNQCKADGVVVGMQMISEMCASAVNNINTHTLTSVLKDPTPEIKVMNKKEDDIGDLQKYERKLQEFKPSASYATQTAPSHDVWSLLMRECGPSVVDSLRFGTQFHVQHILSTAVSECVVFSEEEIHDDVDFTASSTSIVPAFSCPYIEIDKDIPFKLYYPHNRSIESAVGKVSIQTLARRDSILNPVDYSQLHSNLFSFNSAFCDEEGKVERQLTASLDKQIALLADSTEQMESGMHLHRCAERVKENELVSKKVLLEEVQDVVETLPPCHSSVLEDAMQGLERTIISVEEKMEEEKELVMSYGVSVERFSELQSVFRYFDADGSGDLSVSEIKTLLSALGNDVTDEMVWDTFKKMDKDGSGKIEFNEFVDVCSTLVPCLETPQDYLNVFRQIAQREGGKIKEDTFAEFFGSCLSPKEFDTLVELIKKRRDGSIDYIQLCKDILPSE
ncbi:hypothetical protein ADUPG1_012391 [Aduncisulcus paluster]|uniref:EF-hand domain-containing protein n=1 Tax=Aduncisulcus paluster TaxID=2918883 RepID=A0ABQ5K2M6_9EUKA|nr:hypothetical protein ADUPG1_012391 [Aduncisulcus paluster]